MADTIINSTIILNETMEELHNQSAFLGRINTQYNDEFAKKGMKAGDRVYPRRPVQFTIRDGATASIQDVTETSKPIIVEPEFGIDFDFTDFDMTLKVDKFRERYLVPAGKRLATELDMRIATRMYQATANFAGTPGTIPSTALSLLLANAQLDDAAAPRGLDERTGVFNPTSNAYLVDGVKGLFNNQSTIGEQNKTGLMKTNFGLSMYMSQNVPSHTVGPLGGTPLVNGANQGITNSGATDNPFADTTSVITDGWTAAAALRLKKGDVITFAGVNAVNAENKQDLGYLRRFVVTADVSSDGSGNATIIVSPAIIAGGAYKNVTARPADNAAITVVSGTASTTYPQNMIFHKDAFAMVSVDMPVPRGLDMAEQITFDGVTLRFVRGFDILNNRRICRFDLMAGFGSLQEGWAVRLTS